MKTNLYNQSGDVVGGIELPDKIFGLKVNPDLVREVLVAQMANARYPLAHTKDRGEVRGGGRKPWRQKGTGRARHGSNRSPIWIGGGVTFGPRKERNFSQKVNKKAKRKALCMVLSGKVKDGELMVLESLKFEEPKTKFAAQTSKNLIAKLNGFKQSKKKHYSILVVTPVTDRMTARAMNNLPKTQVLPADSLNVKDLLEKKYLILLKDAVPVIEKTFKI